MTELSGTALVTGGGGFIGAAISSFLIDRFNDVVVVDNLLQQVHPDGHPSAFLDPRTILRKGDITDAGFWDSLLSATKPDVVIHLAAETGTGQSLRESTRHTAVNVVGTSTMLDALQRNNAVPHRIVLASSRAVYGEGAWQYISGTRTGEVFYPGLRTTKMLQAHQWDFPEAAPCAMSSKTTFPHPTSVYGVTKLAQEELLRLWGDAFNCQIGIVRLQNVYGVGQTPANPYTGIMSIFSRIASNGDVIHLFEDGQVRRDFVYIDDVARAIIAMIDAPNCPTYPIDIGSGQYRTIEDAACVIANIYGAPAPRVTGQWRHGDVRHAWADPKPALDELGFSAATSLEEGLLLLSKWIDMID